MTATGVLTIGCVIVVLLAGLACGVVAFGLLLWLTEVNYLTRDDHRTERRVDKREDR